MAVVVPLKEMKDKGDFSNLHDVVPYAGFLGLSLKQEGDEFLTTMHYSDMLIGNVKLPALHGGTLSALLEMTSLFQVACEFEPDVMPKIVTITVDYMRSGAAKDTFAVAKATRVGRRVVNMRATAWQDSRDKPIAMANVNFLLG